MLTSFARSQARCILAMAALALAVVSCTTGLELPAATTTPIATATNTPPPTPTATAGEADKVEIVREADLPAETLQAWKELNLASKADYRPAKSNEWGYVWVDKEGKIRFLDYPVLFTVQSLNGQSKSEKTRHMIFYFSQTQGQGNMTILTGMELGAKKHGIMEISGTNEQAMKFFTWIAQQPIYQNRNRNVLKAFKEAGEGKINITLVYADMNQVPENMGEPAVFNSNSGVGYRIEGHHYLVGTESGKLSCYNLEPFERNGRVFMFMFEPLNRRWLLRSEDQPKGFSLEAFLASRQVVFFDVLPADRSPVKFFNFKEWEQAVAETINYWLQNGPAVDGKILE